MLYEVTLDTASPETLSDLLADHPAVSARHAAPAVGHGFPSFTFTGPLSALVDMVRTDWEDGSGDPLETWKFVPIPENLYA